MLPSYRSTKNIYATSTAALLALAEDVAEGFSKAIKTALSA